MEVSVMFDIYAYCLLLCMTVLCTDYFESDFQIRSSNKKTEFNKFENLRQESHEMTKEQNIIRYATVKSRIELDTKGETIGSCMWLNYASINYNSTFVLKYLFTILELILY